jgi:Spy/CpxP family protein refolding chaperone
VISRGGLIIAMLSALLFGATVGLLGGVAFTRCVLDQPMGAHGIGRPWGRRPMPMPGLLMLRLERELKLTDAQRHQIQDVLDHARSDFGALRDSTHARLERVLTPEQQTRWHQLELERRARNPEPAPDEGGGRP